MLERIIAAALIVALGGCAKQERDERPMAGGWSADIVAVGEHGHSGFVVVSLDADGVTRANVTLTGGSAGGVHPWHIHEGTCGSDGPIVGDAAGYPVLRPDEGGDASATASVTLPLSRDGRYHINLHQSAEDDTVVGCGELVPL